MRQSVRMSKKKNYIHFRLSDGRKRRVWNTRDNYFERKFVVHIESLHKHVDTFWKLPSWTRRQQSQPGEAGLNLWVQNIETFLLKGLKQNKTKLRGSTKPRSSSGLSGKPGRRNDIRIKTSSRPAAGRGELPRGDNGRGSFVVVVVVVVAARLRLAYDGSFDSFKEQLRVDWCWEPDASLNARLCFFKRTCAAKPSRRRLNYLSLFTRMSTVTNEETSWFGFW